MKKEFQEKGLLPLSRRARVKAKVRGAIRSINKFTDEAIPIKKRKKKGNAFGRIKDRSLFQGGFF